MRRAQTNIAWNIKALMTRRTLSFAPCISSLSSQLLIAMWTSKFELHRQNVPLIIILKSIMGQRLTKPAQTYAIDPERSE
jgi:hypothetical protein